MFVIPGVMLNVPVGAAGVPPQVQTVAAGAAVAGEAAQPVAATDATATAIALIIARGLMCAVPSRPPGRRPSGHENKLKLN